MALKESGKSRADLWQFAGNIALELAVNYTNANCDESRFKYANLEQQISLIEGREKCEMKQTRPLPFRWGRIDCIPDEDKKWTPYPFEATKKERHSNTYGTGTQVIKDLKRDFNMTARETISLMALHGLATHTKNFEEALKYKWFGGIRTDNTSLPGKHTSLRKGTFSNMYYKFLNGKKYQAVTERQIDGVAAGANEGYAFFVGDKNGDAVSGTGFALSCSAMWNNTNDRLKSGPCRFKPSLPGLIFQQSLNYILFNYYFFNLLNLGCGIPADSDLQLRESCFDRKRNKMGWISGCESAELVERNGRQVQVGGPPQRNICSGRGGGFAMPYEVGFVIDFETIDNIPRGCGNLDGPWIQKFSKPDCDPRFCSDEAR